jgi:uncharacterized protein DUF4434
MSRRPISRSVATVVLVAVLSGTADSRPPARLHGTFIQLLRANAAWDEATWRDVFSSFRRLGLTDIVVQWTVHGDLAFYPSEVVASVERPPLETILALADELGLGVLIGLAADPAYWDMIRGDPERVATYLHQLHARSRTVARELAPRVTRHPSFRGWYITEEIEDGGWRGVDREQALFEYLRHLAGDLRGLTPRVALAVSGFSNARTDPRAFGEFWGRLLTAAPLDIILFQDGIGAGKLTLEDLPIYLQALRRAVSERGRELRVVVETFREITTRPFRTEPASFQRLRRQLEVAAIYSSPTGITAFSVPDYMTPLAGVAATELFNAYVQWLATSESPP